MSRDDPIRWGDERSPEALAFLEDLRRVCERHQRTLGHEDEHGAFIVEPFDPHNLRWLADAQEVVG